MKQKTNETKKETKKQTKRKLKKHNKEQLLFIAHHCHHCHWSSLSLVIIGHHHHWPSSLLIVIVAHCHYHCCCCLDALQGWWQVLVIVVGEKHLMIPPASNGSRGWMWGAWHWCWPHCRCVVVIVTSPCTPYVPHEQRGLVAAVGGSLSLV
jgi:hypothetical protein